MTQLVIENLSKSYGETRVVHGINLTVKEGELVALLGPSGCGKTTTLRMVAGFTPPSGGRISLGGHDITEVPAYRRDTGMVFQSYALFPHMTVAKNVAFGLETRRVSVGEQERRVLDVLRMVQLDHLIDRFPRELSGGQQQRVALARALVVNPAALLLDEPLSNLDAKLRTEVRLQIRALQQRLGLTTLMVTHDQEEALTMADRLVVMEGGRVRQTGSPEELYETPADTFVANFIGRCNLIEGTPAVGGGFVTSRDLRLPLSPSAISATRRSRDRDDLVFALRPERIRILPAGLDSSTTERGDEAEVRGVVRATTYLGAACEYHVDVGDTRLIAIQPSHSENVPNFAEARGFFPVGAEVVLRWPTDAARLVPRANSTEK